MRLRTPDLNEQQPTSTDKRSHDWLLSELTALQRHVQQLPASEPVRRLLRTVELGTAFLSDINAANEGELPHDAALHLIRARVEIEELLRRIRVVALAIQDGAPLDAEREAQLDRFADSLYSALNELLEQVRYGVMADGPDTTSHAAWPVIERHRDIFEARSLADQARGARNEAVQAQEGAQRAAGIVGSTSLGDHFAKYARRERRAADLLRNATIAILFVVTAIAAVVISGTSSESATGEELAKLSLTLPLAALAAYLGREASRHREAAQWASELEVQLLTLEAYTEPLSDALREQLRAELGRRVFTSQVHSVARSTNTPSTASDGAALVRSLADVLNALADRRARPKRGRRRGSV